MADLAINPVQHNKISYYQHSLKKSFNCIGTGLHTGFKTMMTVMPAPANTGYRFIRKDVSKDKNEIIANWQTVSDTRLSTTVSNTSGVRACTIEHLLAALSVSGVDNAYIIINTPEVPIMDGSALPFMDLIDNAGIEELDEERKAIVIEKSVHVRDTEKSASLLPGFMPEVDLSIDFESPVIGNQSMQMIVNANNFKHEVMAARTFGFVEQLTTLQSLGFALGGSLHNAVLVGKSGIINESGLRFQDEFVRHKMLDCIGDLALAGGLIFGRCVTDRSGHFLNNQLLHELFSCKENYSYKTIQEIEKDWWKLNSKAVNDNSLRRLGS